MTVAQADIRFFIFCFVGGGGDVQISSARANHRLVRARWRIVAARQQRRA